MARPRSGPSRADRIRELRLRIRRPPSHRLLVALCIGTLLLVLMANGLATRTDGQAATNAPAADAPLANSRPLLTEQRGRLRSHEHDPGRRVALTFDDGPDAKWTPRIAAALRRLHVRATFFVMGSHVARNPEIARRLHEQGFELGNHTFNHTDLSAVPSWQRSLQLSLTDAAVAGAAGVRPRLMRPPYSSSVGAVTHAQSRVLAGVGARGYLIALSQFDGRDWARPGVARIVRATTPPGRSGGVVLLHDGGGDRKQTLSALERLVPRLRARGFRFVTVSQLAGLPRDAAELPASRWQRLRGQALIGALTVARSLTGVFGALLVAIGLLTVARLLLTVLFARRHVTAARRRERPADFTPPLSVIVPAYNEALDIEQSLRSLDACDYPEFELIVVDDGSTDDTAAIVEGLGLERVRLVTQENEGKPAALNRGCSLASHELIVMVDADTVFESETLRRLVMPLEDPGSGRCRATRRWPTARACSAGGSTSST
jgi:peptidoglycan/xylan/chitin deacetylase (PgdA/CDA1 family)